MVDRKFEVIMDILVPRTAALIAERFGMDELSALKEFYGSKTYAALEDPDTWVWHFSPLGLCDIYVSEKETGTPMFPEET